jgi:hypothetical protein
MQDPHLCICINSLPEMGIFTVLGQKPPPLDSALCLVAA